MPFSIQGLQEAFKGFDEGCDASGLAKKALEKFDPDLTRRAMQRFFGGVCDGSVQYAMFLAIYHPKLSDNVRDSRLLEKFGEN